MHYAEHTLADLRDAQGLLRNTYSVVTADGNVSGGELKRLITACNVVHAALNKVYIDAPKLLLSQDLLSKLEVSHWSEALGEFKLPLADQNNINDWLNVVDGWINLACSRLAGLKSSAMELLLLHEDAIVNAHRNQSDIVVAPAASQVPESYSTLLPGSERKRQDKLGWWDRFQTADGAVASVARFAVAGSILGSVLFLGGSTGNTTVSIYNGLARQVEVQIANENVSLPPFRSREVVLERSDAYSIRAQTSDGQLIEQFKSSNSQREKHFVYNIASAATLLEWSSNYGGVSGSNDFEYGAPRWSHTRADYVFTPPPESIQTKGRGETRQVLQAISETGPSNTLAYAKENEIENIIRAHVRFDDGNSAHTLEWLEAAGNLSDLSALLKARLESNPYEVISLRAEQDNATGAERSGVCARHSALAKAQPQSTDLQYLVARCIEPSNLRNFALLKAFDAHPGNAWLQYSAAYIAAERAQWDEASQMYEKVLSRLPPIAERASLSYARVLRQRGGAGRVRLATLALEFPTIRRYLALENEAEIESNPSLAAMQKLAKGEIDAAKEIVKSDVSASALVDDFIALSETANSDQIAALINNKEKKSLLVTTAWPSLALAMREKSAKEIHLARAIDATGEEDSAKIIRFLEALNAGINPEQAQTELNEIDPQLRGVALVSGIVLLRDGAPLQWRIDAKQLLFALERPYFRN